MHFDFVVSDSRAHLHSECDHLSISSYPLYISHSLSLFYSISLYLSYLVSISLYLSLLSIIFLSMSLSATLCPSIYLSVSPDLYVSLHLFLFYLWISLSLFALPLPVYFPLSWNMCMPTFCFGYLGHTGIPNVFLQTLWPWLLIDAELRYSIHNSWLSNLCSILWKANLAEIRYVDETAGCLDETVWNLVKRVDLILGWCQWTPGLFNAHLFEP